MLDKLIGPFLQSAEGSELLKNIEGQGLTRDQASAAVNATAEGVSQQQGGAQGGIGALAGGALGGGALGGAGSGGGGMVNKVAQFVAQKTGLDPAKAQSVVAMVLPKLLNLVKGAGKGTPAQP
jgi:hypothetical protein